MFLAARWVKSLTKFTDYENIKYIIGFWSLLLKTFTSNVKYYLIEIGKTIYSLLLFLFPDFKKLSNSIKYISTKR